MSVRGILSRLYRVKSNQEMFYAFLTTENEVELIHLFLPKFYLNLVDLRQVPDRGALAVFVIRPALITFVFVVLKRPYSLFMLQYRLVPALHILMKDALVDTPRKWLNELFRNCGPKVDMTDIVVLSDVQNVFFTTDVSEFELV